MLAADGARAALDEGYGLRCHPHVEREVEEQLREAGNGRMRMVAHGRGYQDWEEEQKNSVLLEKSEICLRPSGKRRLIVYFMRLDGVHEWAEKWTRKTTREVTAAMGLAADTVDPDVIYLFIVIGGTIRHHGEGNVYVSGPVLHLPPSVSDDELQIRGRSTANLLEEFHTFRRGRLVPVGVQDARGNWTLRAAGGSNPWEGPRQRE
jgi:hypothetical protein